MTYFKKFTKLFFMTLLFSAVINNAYAAEMITPPEIPTLSGGIGDGGMDAIAAVQQQYSLKLIFAETNGEYLADIGVEIQDNKGSSILNMTSVDSILLIKLLPGKYLIKATSNGETQTHKIVIQGHKLVTYYFHFSTKEF